MLLGTTAKSDIAQNDGVDAALSAPELRYRCFGWKFLAVLSHA